MTSAIKTGCLKGSSFATSTYLMRTALFHSTPVSDRKRRTFWDSGGGGASSSNKRSNNYSKRIRRMHAKESLLRNVGAYAESLFQSDITSENLPNLDYKNWRADDDYSEPSSSKGSSWFRKQHKGPKKTFSQGPRWETYRCRGGVFRFCDGPDEELEKIFRTAFGGETFTYSSFINDDYYQRNSSDYSNSRGSSWKWRHSREDDYDSYEHYDETSHSSSSVASDRLALGLSTSGPLKLDDVKVAYRACALKWHPDRHQGSSKAVAEEKFKLCSAAYQSLCDKLV